jgi:hypothetical protein
MTNHLDVIHAKMPKGGKSMRGLALCSLLLLASPVWAGSQSFDWIVDPVPELPVGTVKTTLIQSYVPKGHPGTQGEGDVLGGAGTVATQDLMRTAIRSFYGLTNNVALMYQLNLAKPNGTSYQYEGSEFGTHLRFTKAMAGKLAAQSSWNGNGHRNT